MSTDGWVAVVADRYMSLLRQFDDAELAAGVAEIRQEHGATVQFEDTYTFVLGVNSPAPA